MSVSDLNCKYDAGQRARGYTSAINAPTSFFTPSLLVFKLSLGSQFLNLSFPLKTFFGQVTKFSTKPTRILHLVGYFHQKSLYRMEKKALLTTDLG